MTSYPCIKYIHGIRDLLVVKTTDSILTTSKSLPLVDPSTYSCDTWRLTLTDPTDGATNMAIDEAILHAVAQGQSPATLRFFAWNPPCLSLGRSQSANDANLIQLLEYGWDVVRRPTGGRAILHVDELTYSIVAPVTEPRLSGGVIESYRRLSSGLLEGLHQIGISAQNDKVIKTQKSEGPVCFEEPSDYEITVAGQKLLGSAQLRKLGVVLQHGSLPLSGDIARICDCLIFADQASSDRARSRVRKRAATLASVLRKQITWEASASAMASGFSSALNLSLEQEGLSTEEWRRTRELRAEKYSNDDWTLRV